MENSANYHLFKDGIKPMWEDPANANGGRWIVTLLNRNLDLLDRCWMELAYSLVGEQLDAGDDICGAVLSRRPKADRLAVWVRDKDNVEAINGIGKRLVQMLDLSKERISLEFQITTDSRSSGPPRSYVTLESIKKDLAHDSPTVDITSHASGVDTTPSLSVDSVSVTPVSVATPSPVTPYSIHLDSEKSKDTNALSGAAHDSICMDDDEISGDTINSAKVLRLSGICSRRAIRDILQSGIEDGHKIVICGYCAGTMASNRWNTTGDYSLIDVPCFCQHGADNGIHTLVPSIPASCFERPSTFQARCNCGRGKTDNIRQIATQ
ncbi:hypothetical protein BGX27_011412 [Mortierella sp. AM989]|nr:hypothetical protein BGX27_011412 [Mortierella sp. AM989]